MSLIARRLLGSLLIALVVAISFLGAKPKEQPAVKLAAEPPATIFKYANSLTAKEGRLPSRVVVDGRRIKLKRKGSYAALCLSDGCALLKDYSRRFIIVVGPDAKKQVWEQRK